MNKLIVVTKPEVKVEMTEEFEKLLRGFNANTWGRLKVISGVNNSETLEGENLATFRGMPRILRIMGFKPCTPETLLHYVGQNPDVIRSCGLSSFTENGRMFSAYKKGQNHVILSCEEEGECMGIGNPCEGCQFLVE